MGAERQTWLDGLKGFAILLVILGHVLSGYLDAGTFPAAYAGLYTLRTWIYSFHMPLFFLISGYTFTLAYWRDGRLRRDGYFRQLGSLLWLYALFALIQWGVKQAVPELVNETYDLTDLRRMFVEPLGNFWYLYVLIVLYLLGAALRTPAWPERWLLLPGALAIVAADAHLDWYSLTLYRIVYHLAFFCVGSALCRHRGLLRSRKLLGVTAMGLATTAYFYCFLYTRWWYANWKFGIALGISYLLTQLFYRCRPLAERRVLQLFGRRCLEVYLLHTFFTAGLRSLLPLLGVAGPWASVWLNFLVSAGASLGLALLAARASWTDVIFRPARFWRRLSRRNHSEEEAHGASQDSEQ